MTDFKTRVWDNERIYMVDFGRAPNSYHPTSACPDIDRYGYTDDNQPAEHGPAVSCTVGQRRINVRFYRAEISTAARLYAITADGNTTIQILAPSGDAPLSQDRSTTISFRPRAAGRTAIEIRYRWRDGPVIGRLYVEVRTQRTIRARVHLVSVGGTALPANFLGQAAPAGTPAATHQTNVLTTLIRDTNRALWPHGLYVRNVGTVNTNWAAALFGPATHPVGHPQAGQAIRGSRRVMRAMALSPNRSAAALNIYIADTAPMVAAGVAVGNMVGLGPPVPWANNIGANWADAAGTNHAGTGIWIHAQYAITGQILAHEVGHILLLCSLTAAGAVNQWHSTGDPAVSRDDYLSRRRLMYNITNLLNSGNAWRNDVGYGNNMGALLTQRGLTRDGTFRESRRAYDNCVAGNLYAT